MQARIHQAIALVTYRNARFKGRPHADLLKEHPAFQFVEKVDFLYLERVDASWHATPFATSPAEWLVKLLNADYRGFRIIHQPTDNETLPDRRSTTFVGGGGRWFIEAVSPLGSDFWEARWDLGNQQHPQRKIWQVAYGMIAHGLATSPQKDQRFSDLSEELQAALRDCIIFARRNKLEDYTIIFEVALEILAARQEPELHGVAPPGDLPLPAARLAAASFKAWVFGGMGSWNDIYYEDETGDEYERVSERLYQAITGAMIAAVNSTFAPTGTGF